MLLEQGIGFFLSISPRKVSESRPLSFLAWFCFEPSVRIKEVWRTGSYSISWVLLLNNNNAEVQNLMILFSPFSRDLVHWFSLALLSVEPPDPIFRSKMKWSIGHKNSKRKGTPARREHGLFISRLLLYLIHIHEPPLLWSIFLCSDVTIFNELGFGGPLKCHH